MKKLNNTGDKTMGKRNKKLVTSFGMFATELSLGLVFLLVFKIEWTIRMLINLALYGGAILFNVIAVILLLYGLYDYFFKEED